MTADTGLLEFRLQTFFILISQQNTIRKCHCQTVHAKSWCNKAGVHEEGDGIILDKQIVFFYLVIDIY